MGIGGGAILIPSLVIFLGEEQHTAQAVNLLYFIPTAIAALFIHAKNKSVDVRLAFVIILCGLLGAIMGACIATSIPSGLLKKMFGVFLLGMGLYEFSRAWGKRGKTCKQNKKP
jgi:hypothetical protein